MICASCGTAGPADGRWCPNCFVMYGPAAARVPPPRAAAQAEQLAPVAAAASIRSARAMPPPPPTPPPGFAPPPATPVQPPPAQPGAAAWPAELGLVVTDGAVAIGDLPRVCVITGRPTDQMYLMRWSFSPTWAAPLMFLGHAGRRMYHRLSEQVAGYLPIHPETRRAYRRRTQSWIGGALAGLAMVAVGVQLDQAVVMLAGLAVVIGCAMMARRSAAVLPVHRAAPGFLSLPKAHPDFRAAFEAGAGPDHRPWSDKPAEYVSGKRALVYVAVFGLVLAGGYALKAHNRAACQPAAVHPGAGQVIAALTHSEQVLRPVLAAPGAPTKAGAATVAAEHQRLVRQLQSIQLNAGDRSSLAAYEQVLTSYDQRINAALAMTDHAAARSIISQENATLRTASVGVQSALASVPVRCGAA